MTGAPAPLDRDEVRACLTGAGTMLPAAAYTDEAVLAWERRAVFDGGWVCVGRSTDVAGPHAQRAVRLANDTALLVRDDDDVLRGFYNTCRSRPHELLPDGSSGSDRFITCRRHNWVYDLRGQLHTVPDPHKAIIDRAGLGLKPVTVVEWQGFIFVNATGTAAPIADYLGGLDDLLRPYELDRLVVAAEHEYTVAANWKIVIENYHECYHCPTLHPQLCQVSPPTSGTMLASTGLWIGGDMELADGADTMSLTGRSDSRPMRGVQGDDLRRVLYLQVVPNLLLSAHPDYVMTHVVEPRTAGQAEIRCQWLFPPEAIDRHRVDPAYAVNFWDITNRQDWTACESVQRGIRSAGYRPGPLSEAEEEAVLQSVTVVARAYLEGQLPDTAARPWCG